MSTVYVVGLGPGAGEQMTVRAEKILEACPVILGYTVYIDLVRESSTRKKVPEYTYEAGSETLSDGI